MKLKEYAKEWKDSPEYHKEINDTFIGFVNDNPKLKDHRDFVEGNAFGFGERSFHWLHKLLDLLHHTTFYTLMEAIPLILFSLT